MVLFVEPVVVLFVEPVVVLFVVLFVTLFVVLFATILFDESSRSSNDAEKTQPDNETKQIAKKVFFMIRTLKIHTTRQGLHDITTEVAALVKEVGLNEGLCTVFIRHTSASLTIQENADPSARRDLETWLNRLVPENDPLYTHTAEGPDDMPSHIKAILTSTTLSIPILKGALALGTWQGVYLWEHRRSAHTREIVVHMAA